MTGDKLRRNYSIDYFKYFCALLIVVIHVHPLRFISEDVNNVFTGILPRIAVPFFFVASGYFYAKKLYADKKPFRPYVLKLFTAYTFWSALYASKLILVELKNRRLDTAFIKKLIIDYFFYGVSEHLWYCISLFIAICLLTLIYRLGLKKAVIYISCAALVISVLGVTYKASLGSRIPLLGSLFCADYFYKIVFRLFIFGVCYVFLGAFIAENEQKITSSPGTEILLVISIILYAAEKLFNIIHGDDLLINITLFPMIMIIFAVLLRHSGSGQSAFSPYARNAATFTYYAHIMVIDIVGYVLKASWLVYIAVAVLCLIGAVVLTKINNKKLNYLAL
jgi:serine/alanine racemase